MASTDSVQQVRDRVLRLAREIESLSRSAQPPGLFFPEFLAMLTRALGAAAGAVWMLEDGNRLSLVCDVNLAETEIPNDPNRQGLNQKLLTEVISTGQATSYGPEENSEEIPSRHVVILAALQEGDDCVGVVEIFQRADSPREARPGYLQFVEQMSGYASEYLSSQKSAPVVDSEADFWNGLEELLLKLQLSRDISEIGPIVANDGRALLNCDRVSVAYTRGRKTTIAAISGQDSVNHRANQVRLMRDLVVKVIATGDTLTYSGRVEDLPPQISKPLAEYIHASGSRLVQLCPLFESVPLIDRTEDPRQSKKNRRRRKPVGCLIVEQVSESRPKPQLLERAELLSDHIAATLTNVRNYQRIFFLPIWRFLGRILEWFQGRKLAKTLAILSIIVAIGCGLVFIPYDYRIEGTGRLMPIIQQDIFCRQKGEVVEIFVKSGQHVEADQELLKLKNKELDADLIKIENEIGKKKQERSALETQLNQAPASSKRSDRLKFAELEGQVAATRVEIRGLRRHQEILKERHAELVVRSPIAGTVATFQLEQLLADRPVDRGEVLMQIMDEKGDWHLELLVEERRMGHMLSAREELENENLDVEFILATDAEVTFDGQLERIATRSETDAELGAIVQVYVSFDVNQLPKPQIGAEVRSKINCGKRSLGYVMFGDVIEFLRQRLWL